jgi:hypothetical protein
MTTVMPTLDTDMLADLIRAKRTCLIQLRDMGRRQLELIDGGDMTTLLDLLAAKQRTLNQLQRVERALDPFRGQDPETRPWRSPDDRAACAEQLAQCEALLGEIVSQEKLSETQLVRRRDEAAARLQGAHLASHARGAYAGVPYANVNQLDLSSES